MVRGSILETALMHPCVCVCMQCAETGEAGGGGVDMEAEEMIMPICGGCQVCRPSLSSSPAVSRLRARDAPFPSSHSIRPLQLPATTLTSTTGHRHAVRTATPNTCWCSRMQNGNRTRAVWEVTLLLWGQSLRATLRRFTGHTPRQTNRHGDSGPPQIRRTRLVKHRMTGWLIRRWKWAIFLLHRYQ